MPSLNHEKRLWSQGLLRVVGVDEVGMAALAGPVIAAASIVAKVTRDRLMAKLAEKYPGYGWEHNCGYPTIDHRKALRELGVTPFHRQDFGTVRMMLSAEQISLELEGAGLATAEVGQ